MLSTAEVAIKAAVIINFFSTLYAPYAQMGVIIAGHASTVKRTNLPKNEGYGLFLCTTAND